MPPKQPPPPTWHGKKTGWLFNYHVTTLLPTAGGRNEQQADAGADADDVSRANGESALQLFFIDLDGETFECPLKYSPYFFVAATEGHEREVELGLTGTFAAQLENVTVVEKEDLGMINHLSGRKRKFLKLAFLNTNDLTAVRALIDKALQRNRQQDVTSAGGGFADAELDFRGTVNTVPIDAAAPGAVLTRVTDDDHAAVAGSAEESKLGWMRWIEDIREYDVKYFTRVSIDLQCFVGLWYDVHNEHGIISLERCDDSKYAPAMPRICAFDIETTKAPLKFPQVETDQIYMISYMLDTRGFLIVNREIVSEDIDAFEYTPKPEYEGHFEIFNVADEKAVLRTWYDEMKKNKPHVFVTYNGDYFDFPFIQARSEFHGMNLRYELGFAMSQEGATLNPRLPHIDAFYWVKRDSYLPQGSQGLKAVTKAKLGFEPIEVDPEDMLPLAREQPQMMASYSVSDAVSTYYLYMKYVHPFIFSLCTIIPLAPDDVLRKGSGTLCESLLCVEAHGKNVIWPNKQVQQFEKFHDGHLIDSETYIGGRVEALESGVFRSDIPIKFKCVPDAFTQLSEQLDDQLRFTIEVENSCKMEDITNYEEVRDQIRKQLFYLRDNPNVVETPLIYHLDVGAMYPSIILTNRLQPPAMVTAEVCAGCCYNTPDNEFKCKRPMHWKWKGEMFTAGRHEFHRVKAQLETEAFATAAIEKADAAAETKKTYGTKRGNVLEGTSYERQPGGGRGRGGGGDNWRKDGGGRGGGGGGGGYRRQTKAQETEAKEALLNPDGAGGSGSDDEDGDGATRFHKLKENTQFALLKKRMGEYSRKAYGKVHETKEILKTATVCQRENNFYVETVRRFRDRRYFYKHELKRWKGVLDKATDAAAVKEARSRCVQMESLQLAHKCILNSFYGYVMRKGSRWSSMEMAGVVTYLGAGLIMLARQFVQQIGVTLELDTDGIWCCLPVSFPDNFAFTTKDPKKKVAFSYPCVILNKDVNDRYTNHQYQDLVDGQVGAYTIRSDCAIYFEVDGPYRAMILPAAREQGKTIKKRYAVFHPDGRLAELKGFELKRRGELMLVKDFQSQVFRRFLDGSSLADAYASAAKPANDALDMLFTQGEGYEDEEVMAKLTESSNMTRRLAEYPATQKSLALTTARRIAEFLGPQMVKDKGLSCVFIISRLPQGKPVTERPIPLNIFKAEAPVRVHYLRQWTGDHSITVDTSVKELLDWNYYIARFNACLQKIITIPAALQHVTNPVPRVPHPDWLQKVVSSRSNKHKQITLFDMAAKRAANAVPPPLADLEDAVNRQQHTKGNKSVPASSRRTRPVDVDHPDQPRDEVAELLRELSDADEGNPGDDDEGSDAGINCDDDDDDVVLPAEAEDERRELAKIAEGKRLEAEEAALLAQAKVEEFKRTYLRKESAPVDGEFFGHQGFKPWLRESKAKWLERVRLRKQLFVSVGDNDASGAGGARGGRQPTQLSAAGAAVTTQFVERKAKAMAGSWHILEVRENPDRHCPAGVDVLALVNGSPISTRVQVQRTVLVEMADGDSVETVFGADANRVRLVTGMKTLPRHHQAHYLYEVDVASMRDGGAALVERLTHREEAVLKVYEAEVSTADALLLHTGAIASVNSHNHLARVARDSASRANQPAPSAGLFTAPRDAFLSSELSALPAKDYLGGANSKLRHVFVFHAAAPESDIRAFVAAFFPATGEVVIAVSQPVGAARPAINMKSFIAEAAEAVGVAPEAIAISDVKTTFVTDHRAALGVIDQAIDDSLNGPAATRVQIAIVQSAVTTVALANSNRLPTLSTLAALRTLGSTEDDRIFVTHPLTWVRDMSRRAVQRFAASYLWLDERRIVASVSNVPLCNLAQDVYVGAWDVLYQRALRRRGHVLWRGASDSTNDDEEEEKPTQTACPGGHLTWSVEFSIGQVDIVATLFSQTIQEGDDPSMLALTDCGIGSHFAIMRDLVSELYGRALGRDQGAGAILVNYSRWLRCTMSRTYDPVVVSHINNLVTRVLAALLIRITKLGGRIVRADRRSIVVGSTKTSLRDCLQFSNYLVGSVADNTVLRHLAPSVVRYWPTIIVVDRDDYVGFALEAERLNELLEQKADLTDADLMPAMELKSQLEMVHDYSLGLQHLFSMQVYSALKSIEEAKLKTDTAIRDDPTVTLATRFDRFLDLLLSTVAARLESEFQPAVIREVSDMVDRETGVEIGIDTDDGVDDGKRLTIRAFAGGQNGLASEAARREATHPSNVRVALRYCKDLCHILSLVPRCEGVVRKSKNNCLRLCGIGPFAAEATWSKHTRGVAAMTTTCHFCNETVEVDLSRPVGEWRCVACSTQFLPDSVEAMLVRRCRRMHLATVNDDRYCPKCRQVAATAVVSVCSCGGALKQKTEPPLSTARQIHSLARAHNLIWLEEVSAYLLESFGAQVPPNSGTPAPGTPVVGGR
jgi:DNA polymerase epsilon subunit 1